MKDFNYWKKLHDTDHLSEFTTDSIGLIWLKTKSIVRKELLTEFVELNEINLDSKTAASQFIELFNILCKDIESANNSLNDYFIFKNREIFRDLDTEQLVSELFKLKSFDWGGDYTNSLDKSLVSKYVKKIKSFDTLVSKFDLEIIGEVKGYILNSWYNHWSSILIEHIFKSNQKVTPTVGQIKNVDFFISDIPFDLKVTYFPAGFLKLKRKEMGFPVELTFLKKRAKEAKLTYNGNAKPTDLYYEIVEKMKNRNDDFCIETLNLLKQQNTQILKLAIKDPKLLINWLYEEQGEMRFSAENRLFLVLVDSDDFTNSWKLKRNMDLLRPSINKYLDNFKSENLDNIKVNFRYKDKEQSFMAYSDIIFVVK